MQENKKKEDSKLSNQKKKIVTGDLSSLREYIFLKIILSEEENTH